MSKPVFWPNNCEIVAESLLTLLSVDVWHIDLQQHRISWQQLRKLTTNHQRLLQLRHFILSESIF